VKSARVTVSPSAFGNANVGACIPRSEPTGSRALDEHATRRIEHATVAAPMSSALRRTVDSCRTFSLPVAASATQTPGRVSVRLMNSQASSAQ
jgi:hypothetical protein